MRDARREAAIAFLFHGPGLRAFTPFRFDRALLVTNAVALGLTILATGAAAALTPHPLASAAATFVVGHFAWSAYLAWRVLQQPPGVNGAEKTGVAESASESSIVP